MFLWGLIIILAAIALLYLFGSNDLRKLVRSVLGIQPVPAYRIWTSGTMNGVKGEYHMVAMGISQYTANQLLLDNIKDQKLAVGQAEFNLAVLTLAAGTVVFYFRAEGDNRPFKGNEALYLRPTGEIGELTFADTFVIHNGGTITIPCLDHNQITVCNNNTLCTPGVLIQGGLTPGDDLIVESVSASAKPPTCRMYAKNASGAKEYLTIGQHLCPYNGVEVALQAECRKLALSGQEVGGPTIPGLTSGVGEVFRLELAK